MFLSYINEFICSLKFKHVINEVINIFTIEVMENTAPKHAQWTWFCMNFTIFIYLIISLVTFISIHFLQLNKLQFFFQQLSY